MKVLVTGGAGFTGNRLARMISEKGHQVRLIVKSSEKIKFDCNYRPEIIEGDLRDPKSIYAAVKGCELVFHIAAVFRRAGISDRYYWDVHVNATRNLLEAALSYKVSRFVHCSTMGVHGHIENLPADETYPYNPGDIYQKTKLEGELLVHRFHKETGLPAVVVRPCAIYGPGDLRLLKLFKLSTRKHILLLGHGEIYYHLVHVDDLVRGFIMASEAENAIGGAFLIGGDEVISLNGLVLMINRLTVNNEPYLHHFPVRPFQILGDVTEKIFKPFGLEPPIYRRRVDFFTKSRYFNIEKAKTRIGYRPQISLREGLLQTANWYRNSGFLSF